MKYSITIISLLLFCSCNKGQKTNTADQSKPDIVFILIDDQAWNLLGIDGRYTFMKTPNLDQLAREGMVF